MPFVKKLNYELFSILEQVGSSQQLPLNLRLFLIEWNN